ncbi:MAG: phospholipid/cholesterol/gamma-HCH transport system substrate-binding protein [Thermoleophilaceae bacterium]|jgi:virulence factor Mce-like protein|nr:phospholipid/cholesterol/gamma-HCH transport system substrate-binding protein [Thermoleophilaceae bacterium]
MARTPFTDIPRGAAEKVGIKPVAAGLIFLVITIIATYFAFSKANPFAHPYELNAVFSNANELKERSPVRIAGVLVGKVKSVEPFGTDKAKVRMEIDKSGLPIHEDAQLKVRQRIFLEGNYFVDLQPGTPGSPVRRSGSTVPPAQTASPVQFGQLLTALQSDTRQDLRTFLREYAKGVSGRGSRGFNMAVKYWEEAYRNTAISTRATLGQRPGDLQRVLKGQGKVFGALSRDEESLKLLVTSLNRLAGAFARQDQNLQATIPALRDVLRVGRPALASINNAFPSLRAFAREALPAARSSSPTLDVQIPFITQARGLVSRAELRGLVADLRPTVPDLARLNNSQTKSLAETRALASCQNTVLLPFSQTPIPDPDFPAASGQPFFKDSPRSLVGLSGESRMHDANSPIFRVLAGGGGSTLSATNEAGEQLYAQTDLPIDGVRPIKPKTRPVYRPNVPCETQQPPDMEAASGPGGNTVVPTPTILPKFNALQAASARDIKKVEFAHAQLMNGKPFVDPLEFSNLGEQLQAKRLGFKRKVDGVYVP